MRNEIEPLNKMQGKILVTAREWVDFKCVSFSSFKIVKILKFFATAYAQRITTLQCATLNINPVFAPVLQLYPLILNVSSIL